MIGKKTILSFLLLLGTFQLLGQSWQQQVDHMIEVTLDEKRKTLDGFSRITYTNHSPDTLTYIWFHLWPNAYKNDQTAFSEQQLKIGQTDFYFSNAEEKGYINRLDFRADGQPARIEDHPQHIDLIRVFLPRPLAPHSSTIITTPFHVKLPFNYSRSGYDGQTILATQWFPKPAVYDAQGWHPLPYLDQGEFYSEFGNYDVRIRARSTQTVAATGMLKDEVDRENQRAEGRRNVLDTSGDLKRPAAPTNPAKKVVQKPVVDSGIMVTHHYVQDSVHDFAFFASPHFRVHYDTCVLASGKIVDVFSYYNKKEPGSWKNSIRYIKDALRFYSAGVGEYPYSTVKAVQGPASTSGGMEYPTITLIETHPSPKELDRVLAHEIGHNWFYGALATNERAHPWMDEGLNSYYERKYIARKYNNETDLEEKLFLTAVAKKRDQPILTHSEGFSPLNYGLVAYSKSAAWFEWVQRKLGDDVFTSVIQQYFRQSSGRHPEPADLLSLLSTALGSDSSIYLSALKTNGALPGTERSGFKIVSPFNPRSIATWLNNPAKHTLLLMPAAGYNTYDRFMVGAVVSNYNLPPNRIQFVAAPLYSTGARQLNGIGRISYNMYRYAPLQKIQFHFSGARFSVDDFTVEGGRRHVFGMHKLVPGATLEWRDAPGGSSLTKYVRWKSYFIKEEPYRVSLDEIVNGIDTTYVERVTREKLSFNIHEFRLGVENNRALYPFSAELKTQLSQHFSLLAFEANYFFNYREGGLDLRVFAGKFFYDRQKRLPYGFYIDRFALNLSSANGAEDYTYNHYFPGRNEFEGFASQQVAIQDGGFKIRTDLLANKVGQSDDWLAAINLNTTVPSRLNPLSLFPVKIPLRVFADIGTFAEAWQEGAESDRFLFDAGFHVPLFSGILNFYFPVIYSPVYGDYVKSFYMKGKLFRTMTFSIDFNRALQKANRQLEF